MRRDRLAAITGLGLVVASAAGIVALTAGGRSAAGPPAAPTTQLTTLPTRISAPAAVPPPSPVPNPVPTPVRRRAGASTATTTTAVTSSTAESSPTTTSTTLAPITTHDARVGVGVLTPGAVTAPVRVVIPSIDADGAVGPTGVNEAGELAIPADARQLVWWRFGPSPGAAGSAVIAGHLDWKGVPGVFNRLADTPIGAHVTVAYDDGHQQTFVVTSVELVDKPAVAVNGTFARDGDPVLRLVTCGGEFDRASRHYRSNVVVTAVPA